MTSRAVDTVIFDLGGVIMRNGGPRDFTKRYPDHDPAVVAEIVMGPHHLDTDHQWHRVERGEITLDECRTITKQKLDDAGIVATVPANAPASSANPFNFQLNDEMVTFIHDLKSAGIPIAGGHSIDSVEPIYGLVVIGIVDPNNLKRNSGAQEGDCIIVSKPIGVGILSAGLKKERLSASGYEQMIALTTQLNKPGVALAKMADVHALTDVTGFGLAGHLLEMARGANLRAELQWDQIPLVTEAVELAKADIYTGASTRNWQAYGHEINLSATMKEWQQHLITDPQTSGGLLVSCAPQVEEDVIQLLQQAGFGEAKTIGRFVAGKGLGLI